MATATERQRLFRQRRKQGVMVQVDPTTATEWQGLLALDGMDTSEEIPDQIVPGFVAPSQATPIDAFGYLGGLFEARFYQAHVTTDDPRERFFELTRGHVVIMGHRTLTSVPDFAFKDRDILEIHASDRPEDVLARFPSRVVFIGGGPTVYAAYAPFIRHWDINRLPYNGEADRWFDPAWLVVGGHRL